MLGGSGWRRLLVALLAVALILPWAGVRAEQKPDMVDSLNTSTATDSISFEAGLQAAEKGPYLAGQYAWTSINGRVEASPYSTEPRPRETVGDACVFGGQGPGCRTAGDAASATTVNGTMSPIAEQWNLLIIGLVYAGARVSQPFTTGVSCRLGPDGVPVGVAQKPTGAIQYGGSAVLGGTPNHTLNLTDTSNGTTTTRNAGVGVLGLLFALNVEVEVTPRWGWNATTLRAFSEVTATYRIKNQSGGVMSSQTYAARSECGLRMSDGSGSSTPGGMGVQSLAVPDPHRMIEPVQPAEPTSAPGIPTQTGFTTEDTLLTDDGVEYHLLATRELDLEDKLTVRRVLTAIREDGGVEGRVLGAEWWVYSAEAAGEQVPVLEIELADVALIQARPTLPGVLLPSPDRVVIETSESEPAAASETPPAAVPEPEEPDDPDEVEDA